MRLCGLCMRLCILCMRLCKGYTDEEKRKMETCDSHVNEEVKFVTLPPPYHPRIPDLVMQWAGCLRWITAVVQ